MIKITQGARSSVDRPRNAVRSREAQRHRRILQKEVRCLIPLLINRVPQATRLPLL
jgi:hypothetical protein